MEVRPIGPLPGGRPGAGARRFARAPSVDRVVVGARRSHAHVGPSRPGCHGDRRRARCAARRGRAATAVVEQVGPRPVGEAIVRALRSDAGHRRPFRRRPAPAAARRHRQPSVVRLAPRRGERPRRLRQAPAAHGAVRERVRRRFGADDRTRSSTTNWPSTTWPDLDWERIADENGYDLDTFERLFPPDGRSPRSRSGANTTQFYQSHVLKVQIELLRTFKYRPTGGFCFSSLADPAPIVSSSVLDHERVPKDRLRDRPRRVRSGARRRRTAAGLGEPRRAGSRLDVHLVNDLRSDIDFAVVDATATWAGGTQRWRFGGPIPADDVVKVGTDRFRRARHPR